MLKSSCRYTPTSTYFLYSSPTRRFHTVAATAVTSSPRNAKGDPSISTKSHDDRLLRTIFDSHQFWLEFSRRAQADSSRPRKGLFENRYLTQASGFHDFTQATLQKCRNIVAKVVASSTSEDYKAIPREMDRLSDSLCRVLDIAEFVRATHPSRSFQRAADEAFATLFEYMNILNTTTGLNSQLRKAVASPQIASAWGEEERIVARNLLIDFSKSAIDLPQKQRERFVELSSNISQLGTAFLQGMAPARSNLTFNVNSLKGMDPLILRRITNRHGNALLPTVGPESLAALRAVEEEAVRREIYIAGRIASDNQIQILEKFLELRAEVAALSGYQSYAEMNLSDKMAQSPGSVKSFLTALSTDNSSQINQELDEMLSLKRRTSTANHSAVEIKAWDREFYRARLAATLRSKGRRADVVSAYFSLGTVIQGLSRLFSRLYGVRFVPRETSPGETWNPDVRRLDVLDETEGHIAVVYCDLFAREGKSPNPTHFTLRCSRRISHAELDEASTLFPDLEPSYAANDGMATSLSLTGTLHQLPTIAIICDFPPPHESSHPTLLSFRDVQTLFHEMGHAIHSILGRTDLQVVSGTRCATDFAELPSVLMEHFASDPTVLSLFARHWETDAPLPYELVAEQLIVDRKGQGADTEIQILLAMLDQAYHSNPRLLSSDGSRGSDFGIDLHGGFDTTRVFHAVHARHGSVAEPAETRAQGFFGHLVEYGGTYYSYLFDRAIAGKVWQDVFRSGRDGAAVSRDRGQRLRDEVLRWGGGRDGWRCVAGVLGDDRLRHGGAEAMAEVGRWGVKG